MTAHKPGAAHLKLAESAHLIARSVGGIPPGSLRPETTFVGATYDRALCQLLTSGLIEMRSSDQGCSWQLSPLAQRRLDVVAAPPPPPETLIYFGHRCSTCGNKAPTWWRNDSYQCSTCLAAASPSA